MTRASATTRPFRGGQLGDLEPVGAGPRLRGDDVRRQGRGDGRAPGAVRRGDVHDEARGEVVADDGVGLRGRALDRRRSRRPSCCSAATGRRTRSCRCRSRCRATRSASAGPRPSRRRSAAPCSPGATAVVSTISLGNEAAELEPFAFVAVTSTCTRLPTSSVVSTYGLGRRARDRRARLELRRAALPLVGVLGRRGSPRAVRGRERLALLREAGRLRVRGHVRRAPRTEPAGGGGGVAGAEPGTGPIVAL